MSTYQLEGVDLVWISPKPEAYFDIRAARRAVNEIEKCWMGAPCGNRLSARTSTKGAAWNIHEMMGVWNRDGYFFSIFAEFFASQCYYSYNSVIFDLWGVLVSRGSEHLDDLAALNMPHIPNTWTLGEYIWLDELSVLSNRDLTRWPHYCRTLEIGEKY